MSKLVNGIPCKVVKSEWEVYFDMALTMFREIVKHNEAGERTVFIVPVGPTEQYPILAELINSQRVSLKNVHFFNMDEYLISKTQRIDDNDAMSFHGRMKREFYDRVDSELVMPESQRHFPEPGQEAQYDKMLEDLGGADMCFGGLGINGHVAFNEAAAAGALHVQLGGTHLYFGKPVVKPTIGDDLRAPEKRDIRLAVRMMYAASGLMLALITLAVWALGGLG